MKVIDLLEFIDKDVRIQIVVGLCNFSFDNKLNVINVARKNKKWLEVMEMEFKTITQAKRILVDKETEKITKEYYDYDLVIMIESHDFDFCQSLKYIVH